MTPLDSNRLRTRPVRALIEQGDALLIDSDMLDRRRKRRDEGQLADIVAELDDADSRLRKLKGVMITELPADEAVNARLRDIADDAIRASVARYDRMELPCEIAPDARRTSEDR